MRLRVMRRPFPGTRSQVKDQDPEAKGQRGARSVQAGGSRIAPMRSHPPRRRRSWLVAHAAGVAATATIAIACSGSHSSVANGPTGTQGTVAETSATTRSFTATATGLAAPNPPRGAPAVRPLPQAADRVGPDSVRALSTWRGRWWRADAGAPTASSIPPWRPLDRRVIVTTADFRRCRIAAQNTPPR